MSTLTPQPPPDLVALQQLVARAQAGDDSVLPELKACLAKHPELWHYCGDIAQGAIEALLNLVAGKDLLVRESVLLRMDEIRKTLAGPTPTPLETLLIDRIVVSWLQTAFCDLQHVSSSQEHHRRRLDSAHRRYLQAIKALATVKKLLAKPPTLLQISPFQRPEPMRGRGRGREHGLVAVEN